MRILVLIALVFFAGIRGAPAQEILLRVQDTHGNVVCNNGGSWRPIPNFPGLYIGRVIGTPAPTWCAGVNQPVLHYTTLGIYTLDIPHKTLTLQYELTAPPTTFNGWYIRTIYDAQTMVLGGQVWATAECTAHTADGVEHVSACTFPLIADQYGNPQIDAAHFSVPVLGDTYNGKLASSASTPAIVNWNGTPYLYWTIDNQGVTPAITRGENWCYHGYCRLLDRAVRRSPRSTTTSHGLSTMSSIKTPFMAGLPRCVHFTPLLTGPGSTSFRRWAGSITGRNAWLPTQRVCLVAGGLKLPFFQALSYNVFAHNPQPVDMILVSLSITQRHSRTLTRALDTSRRGLRSRLILTLDMPRRRQQPRQGTPVLPWPADLP